MFGQGFGSYAKAQNAIALDIATTVRSWVGNCFFDPTFGIDWINRMNPGQESNLLVELRTAIAKVDGVVRVNEMSVSVDRVSRKATINYNVDTIYTQSFQAELNALAGGSPSA